MRKTYLPIGLIALMAGCQVHTPNTEPDALASCRARGGTVEEVCVIRRIVFDCVTWGFSCRGADMNHDQWCAMPSEQSTGWNPRQEFCSTE